jgi:RNA polymerase sigma factor (sigma-70 family)
MRNAPFLPRLERRGHPGAFSVTLAIFDELSDEALLQAIAEGAIWAMESLYQRHIRTLYSLALHMVTDQQIAEDLVQEALVAVWRHAASYSPQSGAARSWLIAILHHRTIDYLRSGRHRAVMREVPLEVIDLNAKAAFPDVWDAVWQSLRSEQVRAALMKLSPKQRMVIELAYFQGWTHTEIAQALQIPLGTVKARVRLGLIHLRQLLTQMGLNEM